MDNRTVVIRANKHAGTITTLASFFSRKNISIEQMFCSGTGNPGEMICSVTYACTGNTANIVPGLVKMHDVIDAYHGE